MTEWRRCVRCGREWPITNFPLTFDDGRSETCRTCRADGAKDAAEQARFDAWKAKVAKMSWAQLKKEAEDVSRRMGKGGRSRWCDMLMPLVERAHELPSDGQFNPGLHWYDGR